MKSPHDAEQSKKKKPRSRKGGVVLKDIPLGEKSVFNDLSSLWRQKKRRKHQVRGEPCLFGGPVFLGHPKVEGRKDPFL